MRGSDDSKIVDTGKGLLGFHRLAIMVLHPEGMQPFELDGNYVVCNGEIYGFARIKQILQEKNIRFKANPIVRSCSRFTGNTVRPCFGYAKAETDL